MAADFNGNWSGQLTTGKDGREKIETLWHLARDIPDPQEPAKLWAAIWSGCDTFYAVRIPQVKVEL